MLECLSTKLQTQDPQSKQILKIRFNEQQGYNAIKLNVEYIRLHLSLLRLTAVLSRAEQTELTFFYKTEFPSVWMAGIW